MSNTPGPLKIIIVGGGTAGWMAANLMQKHWKNADVELTLVESPDIGIIGVGEGSTPQLKSFFESIDVKESQWMSRCNATYKNGITFANWSSKPGFSEYFHPFPTGLDAQTAKSFFTNCYLRRHGVDVDAHPDSFFLHAFLAAQSKGPQNDQGLMVKYGYHFDSHLLGEFLREVATERGVTHVSANVENVNLHPSGDIASLDTDVAGQLTADIYIDCSGFRSILLQQALGVGFKYFKDNLFNDSAVVLPTNATSNPNSQTISTALKYGWAWDIPLTNRTGNGYVYASSFSSADQAEQELREKLGLLDSDVEARHLKMKVGRVEKHWHKNCVAIGLAQGFIEPLEATALHLVQDTIDSFVRFFEKGERTDSHRDAFNEHVNRAIEGIRDYIVCHYRVNSRTDTDYWRENATNQNLSDSLQNILLTWLNREDLSAEINRQDIGHYYHSISWHCLLAGYGLFPDELSAPDHRANKLDQSASIRDQLQSVADTFSAHAKQLDG